jgi:hypothetical protein
MEIASEQLGYFDISSNAWVVEPLQVTISIGASSRDLRLEGVLQLH